MKTSKEMADSVFQIRDAYDEKNRKRKTIIKKVSYVVSAACMFGISFWGIKNASFMRNNIPDEVIIDTTENTSELQSSFQLSSNTQQTTTNHSSQNREQTKESKINKVTETTVTNKTTQTETATVSSISEKDTNENSSNEQIKTEATSEQTKPIVTEPIKTVTTNATSSDDTAVQTANNASNPIPDIGQPNEWNTLSIENQYTKAIINNRIYVSSGKEVPFNMLGDYLAETEVEGFDGTIEHRCNAKAFRINEYSDSEAIAIKFDSSEKYYFYGVSQ